MRFSSKRIYDYANLKKYTDTYYKLTSMKCFTQPEAESPREYTPKGEVNEEKLENNLSRAKSKIFEYAYCNPWELFVTLTLDKKKYDRKDLEKFRKDFAQFVRDYKKKYGVSVKYLLIPERHKDGAWHMHGFFMGLPQEHLKPFKSSERLPVKILNRLKNGKQVFTWQAYAEKFGFCDIELIENQEASSKYIMKYVTKEAQRTISELNAHLYYCSQGLKKAEVIHQDILTKPIDNPSYENDYVIVKYFKQADEAMDYFVN